MMNVTGVNLEVGQRLEIRIVDEAQVKADNDSYLRELIQQLITEELNRNVEEKPIAELDSVFEPYFEEFTLPKHKYTQYLYEPIQKLYSFSGDYVYDSAESEYEKLVKKWKTTDPDRWELIQEHNNAPTDYHWNEKRFHAGDRVELHWFLDEMPGYAYLSGKTGTVIKTQGKYVIVHFDGMNQQQSLIPGILNKISGGNKLPKLMDIDLIQTERLGDGYSAWVAGSKSTWEYGETKNEAIYHLLRTWYWNIRGQ